MGSFDKKQMHIIANWKMNFTFDQEITWVKNHLDELNQLPGQLTLCPSFLSLHQMQIMLGDTSMSVGAQSCSAYPMGAHTGQIAAKALQEIGVAYCLVGHSEERVLGMNDQILVNKLKELLTYGICPILCVGETAAEYASGQTEAVITKQLAPFMQVIKNKEISIAYEPLWAIGTGVVPTAQEVQGIGQAIIALCPLAKVLYGGSVTQKTILPYLSIEPLHGFLIGSASLDFQQLKNIVVLIHDFYENI